MGETVKLTACFKIEGEVPDMFNLYKQLVNELLNYVFLRNITSFKRLKSEKYYEMRGKYPELPSHYIYTACQMTCSIYKSFRKLKRKGKAKGDKPVFRKDVIMLDDILFTLKLDDWVAAIATPNGRVKLKLLHGKYHEKFKYWKIGQAWLIKRNNDLFLNVVFSKDVEVEKPINVIGADVNENNVTIAKPNGFERRVTGEKNIRIAYFLKRRRIQSKIKGGKIRRKLLAKYGEREKNRVLDVYHVVANWVVKEALKSNSAIALEDIKNIRKRIKFSREMNGRLHRWSFHKLQKIIEYKAKLNGIPVVYIDAKGTSTYCPICGAKLSPNGQYRTMKCKRCGLIADRDVIGAWNIRLKVLKTDRCGEPRSRRKPPNETGGRKGDKILQNVKPPRTVTR